MEADCIDYNIDIFNRNNKFNISFRFTVQRRQSNRKQLFFKKGSLKLLILSEDVCFLYGCFFCFVYLKEQLAAIR